MWAVGFSVFLLLLTFPTALSQEELECSAKDLERDPNLREMTYDVGDGEKKTWVYVDPDVTTFYKNQDPPATSRVTPKHNGFSGKFINLSNKKASLYWCVSMATGQLQE